MSQSALVPTMMYALDIEPAKITLDVNVNLHTEESDARRRATILSQEMHVLDNATEMDVNVHVTATGSATV